LELWLHIRSRLKTSTTTTGLKSMSTLTATEIDKLRELVQQTLDHLKDIDNLVNLWEKIAAPSSTGTITAGEAKETGPPSSSNIATDIPVALLAAFADMEVGVSGPPVHKTIKTFRQELLSWAEELNKLELQDQALAEIQTQNPVHARLNCTFLSAAPVVQQDTRIMDAKTKIIKHFWLFTAPELQIWKFPCSR
jgi:hypothetical protein